MQSFLPNEADANLSNQAQPDSIDFEILRGLSAGGPTGVSAGCAVSEDPATPDMTVDVAAGWVRLGGKMIEVSAQAGNAITAADGSNVRIDLVTVNSSGTVVVTDGTPAAEPVCPDVPASSVPLAMVYVPASDSTTEDEQIVDKRYWVPRAVYYNVEWYGADVDNADNDTELQACLDAVEAAGAGTIILPSRGAYITTTELTLNSTNGVILRGYGNDLTNGSVIKCTTAGTNVLRLTGTAVLGLRIEDCVLWKSGTGAGAALELDTVVGSMLCQNVRFAANGTTGHCLLADGTDWELLDSKFDTCYFDAEVASRTSHMVELTDATGVCNSNTWYRCVFNSDNSATGYAVYISAQTAGDYHWWNSFIDCDFENHNGGCIWSEGSYHLNIKNCGGYDSTTATAHQFLIGKHASGEFSQASLVENTSVTGMTLGSYYAVHMSSNPNSVIVNSGRVTGSGTGVYPGNGTVVVNPLGGVGDSGGSYSVFSGDEITNIDVVGDSATTARVEFGAGGVVVYDGDNAKRLEILNGGDIVLYDEDGTTARLTWDVTATEWLIEALRTRFTNTASNDYPSITVNADQVLHGMHDASDDSITGYYLVANGVNKSSNPGDLEFRSPSDNDILLTWDESADVWEFSKDVDMSGNQVLDAPPLVTHLTSGATLDANDRLVLADFSTGATVTLPTIASLTLPHTVVIMATGSANVTVDPGTDNIDGSTADKVITGGATPPCGLALAVYDATDDWITLTEQGTVT